MVPRKSKRNLSKSKRRQKRRSVLSGGCWLSDLFKSKNQNQYSQILRNAENDKFMDRRYNGKPNNQNNKLKKSSFQEEIRKLNYNTKRTLLQHRISNTERLKTIQNLPLDEGYYN